jgi:hypothetical protein
VPVECPRPVGDDERPDEHEEEDGAGEKERPPWTGEEPLRGHLAQAGAAPDEDGRGREALCEDRERCENLE